MCYSSLILFSLFMCTAVFLIKNTRSNVALFWHCEVLRLDPGHFNFGGGILFHLSCTSFVFILSAVQSLNKQESQIVFSACHLECIRCRKTEMLFTRSVLMHISVTPKSNPICFSLIRSAFLDKPYFWKLCSSTLTSMFFELFWLSNKVY